MPAKSKAQRRLMGMAYAYKQGKFDGEPSKAVKDLANEMSLDDLKDFAETEEDNLPEKAPKKEINIMKKSEITDMIRKELLKEWWSDIDGMNKKEVQDLLIRNGFDKKKVKRANDDSLYTLYSIAKRRKELKKEHLGEKTVNEAQTDIMKLDHTTVSKIIGQYEALRKMGQYNMFDFLAVQRAAYENKFYDFVNFTSNNKRAYASIIKNYSKLIKLVNKKDIPKAKKLKVSYSLEGIEEAEGKQMNWPDLQKALMKKFGKDPLYKEYIMAKTSDEMNEKKKTLESIRGANATTLVQKETIKIMKKNGVKHLSDVIMGK